MYYIEKKKVYEFFPKFKLRNMYYKIKKETILDKEYYVFYFNPIIDRVIKIYNIKKDYYLFNLYSFCIENSISIDKIIEHRLTEELSKTINQNILEELLKLKK